MRMRYRMSAARAGWTLWLAALVLAGPAGAHAFAQEAASPELPEYVQVNDAGEIVLSPAAAARWALERNTDVRIQAESIAEAMGQLRQAWAADRIQVGVRGTAMRMGPVSTVQLPPPAEDEEPMEVQVSPDQHYQATISARMPLYTGGRTDLGKDLAREGISAAEGGTRIARLSVAMGASEASFAVLRTIQLAGVAAAQVTAVAEHVGNAEVLEEAGMVAQFDVVQARTELARAQEQLIMAQTGVEQAKAQLRRVLALPQATQIAVADAPAPDLPEGDLPELIEVAYENRPEVETREAGVRMARLNLRLAERELAPSVALMGEYSRQTTGGLGGTDWSWQIGVVAEKPIFDGGARRGKTESARARLESAELEVERAKEQVGLEVVQAYLSVQEAEKRIETAEQGLVEARERRRMAQLRYREGLAAGIEVIDADTALAAAEASLVNAEYDMQLAVTRLRTAMGILDVPWQEVESR